MVNRVTAKRRGGNNPLAYLGVEAQQVPNLVVTTFPPTSDMVQNFNIGCLWLVTDPDLVTPIQVWALTQQVGFVATWVQIYPSGSAGATDFITDSGTATQSGGVLNILGGTNINTAGSGNTVVINLDENVSVSGTVDVVPLNIGVAQTDDDGLIFVPSTQDGEVLIGATGDQPQWMVFTSSDNTVAISNGSNTINMDISVGPTQFVTDDGTANPIAGAINYFGDGNTETTATGNEITVDLAQDVTVENWSTQANITIQNDISASGEVFFTGVGSGTMQTNTSGDVFADNGQPGELLIGATGSEPQWAPLTSTGGTISITPGVNTLNIETTGGGGGGGRAAFLYTQNSSSAPSTIGNMANNYFLGSGVVLTEQFDNGNNMFPGDGMGSPAVWTCPVTGRYYLNAYVTIFIPHPPSFTQCTATLVMNAGGRTFTNIQTIYNNNSVPVQNPIEVQGLVDLTATDTVTYFINVDASNAPGQVFGDGNITFYTWVSGYHAYTP